MQQQLPRPRVNQGNKSRGGRTDLVKNVLQALLREGRAFDVLDSAELPSELLALLRSHWPLLLPRQLLQHLRIIPKIDLSADDEARNTRAVVVNLWEPFFFHVFEGCWRCDAEADQEHISLGVR